MKILLFIFSCFIFCCYHAQKGLKDYNISTLEDVEFSGAEAFSILSTPTMFLVDSITNQIVFIPKSTYEIEEFISGL